MTPVQYERNIPQVIIILAILKDTERNKNGENRFRNPLPGVSLDMRPANEKLRYNVTTSLISLVHT